MATRPKPGAFVKVTLANVRSRLGRIADVERLPGAILDGLAKAICVTRPHPPKLGQMITDARNAIKRLRTWTEADKGDPAFSQFLEEVAKKLESHRRRVIVKMKMERLALRWTTVSVDKDGSPHVIAGAQDRAAEPERFFFRMVPSLEGDRKLLNAMLVLGMGELIEFLEEDREQGFKWTMESDRQEETAVRASKMMAKILDEFWADDGRIGQYIEGHVPENILKQHARAAKKLQSFPRGHFLTYLADLPATHAWLPRRVIAPDHS